MKNPAKAIKIVSIIVLIYGILLGIGGILLTAGGGIGTSFVGNNSEAINSAIAENSEASSSMDEINNTFGTDAKPAEACNICFTCIRYCICYFSNFRYYCCSIGLKGC